MKTCSKCKAEKQVFSFSKDATRNDGLQSSCKACRSIAKAAHYAANSEKVRAASTAYHAANREKVAACKAVYYAANTEKMKATAAAHYAANTEKYAAYRAAWQKANPKACRIYYHNRRALKIGSGGKLSKGLSAKLFKLQRSKCACCGKPLGNDYHLDHVMPLKLGGTNTDDNIQLLRAICNLQKNAKHPIDFMQSRGFLL